MRPITVSLSVLRVGLLRGVVVPVAPALRAVAVFFAAAAVRWLVAAAFFGAAAVAFRGVRGAGSGGSAVDGESGTSVGKVDWSRVSPCMPSSCPRSAAAPWGRDAGGVPEDCWVRKDVRPEPARTDEPGDLTTDPRPRPLLPSVRACPGARRSGHAPE
ncbi:hypothetical protein GCM10010440_65630 [Kitasatospora cinereorecta]